MELTEKFLNNYSAFKASEISGRYLSFNEVSPLLQKFKPEFSYSYKVIGKSFLNVPIESLEIGSGPKKILAWSQMHGNETTTTKGIFDVLNFISKYKEEPEVKRLLNQCTFLVIPMLNPDGAARYTRENVNKVDLNRDASALTQPESRVLRTVFEDFKPDFCFNLHDQRTIFGAGEEKQPATISFLAPSMDETREVTAIRENAMKVIVAMNTALQELIPGQVGRFDDSFNINCSGDYFQSREVPTILFECGHYPEDYQREKTRELFAYALLVALNAIATGSFKDHSVERYFAIPENRKSFNDVLLRNALVKGKITDVAIQFIEVMKAGEIHFIPKVEAIAPNLSSFGHREIHCHGGAVNSIDQKELDENDIVEVILLNKEKLSINPR